MQDVMHCMRLSPDISLYGRQVVECGWYSLDLLVARLLMTINRKKSCFLLGKSSHFIEKVLIPCCGALTNPCSHGDHNFPSSHTPMQDVMPG